MSETDGAFGSASDTQNTVRAACLNKIQATLQAMTECSFTKVVIGPIGKPDERRAYFAGVVAGREEKRDMFPLTECSLDVSVEFQATRNVGQLNTGSLYEEVLGQIQKALRADIYLGGIAIDFQEVANDPGIHLWTDKIVVGVIHYKLKYRHSTFDPYRPV